MKSNKKKSLLTQFFILALTVTMIATNAFGSSPNSLLSRQLQVLLLNAIPPELTKPVNEFLGSIGASPLPKANEINVDISPLDPGGYILGLFGAKNLPPLNQPIKLDPAGAILALFNVDANQIPNPSITRDPIGDIAKLFGIDLQEQSKENGPLILDPAGLLLRTFIREEYLTSPELNPLLDPGGLILSLFFPAESLQFADNNPLLDPGGALLSFLFPNAEIPADVANASNPGVDLIAFFERLFTSPLPANTPVASLPLPANTPLPTLARPTASPALPLVTNSPIPLPTLTPISTQPELALLIIPTATFRYSLPQANAVVPNNPAVIVPTDTPIPTNTPTNTPIPPIIVNSLNDPGVGTCDATECTLREAINAAIPNQTINFAAALSGGTIYLQSPRIIIAKNLTIDGSSLASQLTISGDSNNDGTGDIYIFLLNGGSITLKNLTFTLGYFAGNYGGIIVMQNNASLTMSGCNINNSKAFGGGAISDLSSGNLNITNSTFSSNTATSDYGGAIYNTGSGNITIQLSTFSSNIATMAFGAGGAIYNAGSGSITIQSTTFDSNTTSDYGGGIYSNGGSLLLTNVVFLSNAATNGSGGGFYIASGSATMMNVTFYKNTANSLGGGIYVAPAASLTLTNAILWGDSALLSFEIFGGGSTTISYSDIQGNGTLGTNIDSDPLFVSAVVPYDLKLSAGSPAIDTGTNTGCPSTDRNGTGRPINGTCDMGAYEQ